MYSYRYFEKTLKSLGYKGEGNICDFWFDHIDAVSNKVNQQMKTHMDTFGLEIRWKSLIGIVCNEAVRQYLNEKQKELWGMQQAAGPSGSLGLLVNIDFCQFHFLYDNKSVSLNEFVNQFPTSKFTGLSDLRGINLATLSLQNAVLNNVTFAYANFKGSHLFQLTLRNVYLISADLRNSFVINLTFDDKSSLRNADLRGAFVNTLRGVNDISVALPFRYEPVSALYLIGALVFVLFAGREPYFFDKAGKGTRFLRNVGKHTKFLANDVSALTAPDNKMLRRYIDWYQYVFPKLASLRTQSIKDKLFFSLSIVTTKAWSSYVSLAVTGLVINLIFAVIFYVNYLSFEGLNQNFFSAFYYSVVTFTTLGYGDIFPKGGWAQLLVIVEVVLGYVTLGVFVYLLSRKVGDKF